MDSTRSTMDFPGASSNVPPPPPPLGEPPSVYLMGPWVTRPQQPDVSFTETASTSNSNMTQLLQYDPYVNSNLSNSTVNYGTLISENAWASNSNVNYGTLISEDAWTRRSSDSQLMEARTVNEYTSYAPSNDLYLSSRLGRPEVTARVNYMVVNPVNITSNYTPLIQQPRQQQQQAAADAPSTSSENDLKEGPTCGCQKSKCLNLFCSCFKVKNKCRESCKCKQCSNKDRNEYLIREAQEVVLSRNENAFSSKVVVEDGKLIRHKEGCNCHNSRCEKKYCECYNVEVGCTEKCKCKNCKNSYGTKPEEIVPQNANNS